MARSLQAYFTQKFSNLTLVVTGLPALESMLPLAWNEKLKKPGIRVTLVFVREGNLTGFGKSHPLVGAALAVVDEIWIPYGFLYRRFMIPKEAHKLRKLLLISNKITRFISLVTSGAHLGRIEKKIRFDNETDLTIFDFTYIKTDTRYQRVFEKISGPLRLAISHGSFCSFIPRSQRFLDDLESGIFFSETFEHISDSEETVFFYDGPVPTVNSELQVEKQSVDRHDPDWLDFLSRLYHEETHNIGELKKIGLLVSRHGSKIPSKHGLTPSRESRVRGLGEVRQAFELVGLKPCILLHPSEVRDSKELRSWTVVENVHYSVMFRLAEKIVTFGSQIAVDAHLMGKSMIEYGPAREGNTISEHHKLGFTYHAYSQSHLIELLLTDVEKVTGH